MDTQSLIKELETKLRDRVNALKEELMSLRTNRPTPKLVERIPVDAYGQKMTVAQLGSITVVPPREIDIVVWDGSVVSAVAKAIESSPLGVNPSTDGTLIRINLPTLTEERKKELIKVIKNSAEEQRIKIRALRDDANKKVKDAQQEKQLSEDQSFKTKEKIQFAVDAVNKEIETLLENKIRDIQE